MRGGGTGVNFLGDCEAFEDNPLEYLRRDIEGSDAETRRRVACDLVEKMTRQFDNEVTRLVALPFLTPVRTLGISWEERIQSNLHRGLKACAPTISTPC